MASAARGGRLTQWEAIKELGWLPMLLIGLGGFSVLAILEQSVFHQPYELVRIFQWPLDGYRRIMLLLGAIFDPMIQPAIDWISARFGWSLTLNPVWRPMFALGMVAPLAFSRTAWRKGQRVGAAITYLLAGFLALIGAVLAGLSPAPGEGDWWVLAQGLLAAAPLAGGFWLVLRASPASNLFVGDVASAAETIAGMVLAVSVVGLTISSLAVAAGIAPSLAAAGVFTLGLFVVSMGALTLHFGFEEFDRSLIRCGLTILGGFVAAVLIVGADWGLKALGAA